MVKIGDNSTTTGDPIMKKLKSENGASISFALLLFLVCATAGAVVLAAGTAAAGRLSQMVNMDKRYYSASSAASLLANEIKGKEVTIVRSLEEVVVTTTEYDEYGNAGTPTKQYKLTYKTIVNGTTIGGTPLGPAAERPVSTGDAVNVSSFLTKQACYLMFEGENCNTDAAMKESFGLKSEKAPMPFTISGTGDLAALNISGNATLNIDGSLDFEIGSEVDSDTYTLILRMIPDINESPSSSMTSEPFYSTEPDGSYIERITTTETTTITSTISWDVESIQKKVSDFKPTTVATPSGTP